jgi:hypothetical protein
MTTQQIKQAAVTIINDADIGITAVDAEQFSEVELPFIGVTMTTERISNALPKAYRGVVTVNLRAHSGDTLTVEEINAITNDLEALLATGFADALNDELDGARIDYFARATLWNALSIATSCFKRRKFLTPREVHGYFTW